MTDCGQGRGGEAESRLGPSLAWVVRAQRGHLCSGDGARHSSRPEGLCHALGRVRRGLLVLGPPEWGLTLLPTPCSSALPTHLAQGNGVHKKEVVILPAEARVQLLLHDEDDIGWDDVGALGRRDQGVTRTSWLCDMPSSCLYWFPCLHLNNDEIRPGFLERPLQFGSIAPPLRSLPRPPITSPLLSMLKYTRSAGVGQASSGRGHSTELMSDNCLQVSVLLGLIKSPKLCRALFWALGTEQSDWPRPLRSSQSGGGNRPTVSLQHTQGCGTGHPEVGAQTGADPGGEVRGGRPEWGALVLGLQGGLLEVDVL